MGVTFWEGMSDKKPQALSWKLVAPFPFTGTANDMSQNCSW